MKKTIILRILRWAILLSILVLITVLGRLHQVMKLYPSIDAFCPFGGLESAWALIRYQSLLRRIGWSSFVLLFTSVGTAIVFRRSFCGNICPLGFLQELFGLGGRKILKRRFELPPLADKILRYAKYIVLFVFLGLAWKTLALAIRPYDPWLAYHHLGSDELLDNYLIGTIILGLSLLGGIFLDRPFCRYLCPMGAFLAFPSKLGLTKIRRNEDSCTSCKLCDKACPMAIKVSEVQDIKSAECISCSECVNVCPVKDTLDYSFIGKKKIPAWGILLGTVLIFTLTLGITTYTKTFVWKAETGLEKKVERLLWGPHKIKDDNTLMDIVQIFKIHPAYFAQEFGLSEEAEYNIPLSELNIEASDIEARVNALYEEAGLDPTQLFGGGGGCSGEDH